MFYYLYYLTNNENHLLTTTQHSTLITLMIKHSTIVALEGPYN